MRTSTRLAGVLTGLTLVCGGAAFTAPAAHADVSACINQVERELQGGEVPAAVRAACTAGSTGYHDQCVTGLTKASVTKGTAVTACSAAP
ncbi:hypothetical protein ACFVYT_17830 [Streptomyces sp. NPDC058290]|uniref:hypothetical protein n=1 Tax=unclassified Streptomyces TaxID=2593676 RepID=UPI000AAE2F9F|nr:hypothetical protein [Streptomyces sp. NBC_00320]MCX5149787.1 hypothetical protein [Streptomyces sp. NBC_00320]WSW57671.1 hypothetical protein OG513_03305 [Streptomyces sp. NBC_00998]